MPRPTLNYTPETLAAHSSADAAVPQKKLEQWKVNRGASEANKTIRHGNSRVKQAAIAAVPEVIAKGKQIGYEKNWLGFDTYVFAAPIEMNGTKLYEGVIVRSYLQDGRKTFYVHEVCWSDGSNALMNEDGTITKKKILPHSSRRLCGATLRMPRKYLLILL